MSVLAYPRIHFKGRCSIDAATGNNYDAANVLDAAQVALDPEIAATADQDAFAAMIKGREVKDGGKTLAYMWCGWNYGGSLGFSFDGVTVSAVTGSDGVQHPDDGLLNQTVRLLGSLVGSASDRSGEARGDPVMVDLDPMGEAFLTQAFIGGLAVGDETIGFHADHDAHAFSRWVVQRLAGPSSGEQRYSPYGAVFQFGIPHEKLRFAPSSRSPILDELKAAASSGVGI
jgi:hypothetical protein